MENTAPHPSCIGPPASMPAGESSWGMHFADFAASSAHGNQDDMGRQGGTISDSSFSYDYSYSFASLCDGSRSASFITSDLMDDQEEEEDDDSLQDTASSSAAGPKAANINVVYMKSMITMDTKEMNTPQLANYFLGARSRQQATGALQESIIGADNNEKQLTECNDLRKKGLCLVPFSLLIDYLG
ncbi:uncharacterized protein [Aegilops tauschii subsp. strangulata]|uniref:Uncharacterized protein n=1 Tax=Aegilops tauschii TaxID=37682 RepID=M8ANH3_AEGTA|nr:uncharacterized protein LOC123497399 [Aegilops tauschii subsp. strangulata]